MILFFSILLAVFGGPTFLRWWNEYLHTQELKKYAAITEPIFVHSLEPGDLTVRSRAERHRALLHESGNRWPIAVYEYYFQEAGHVRETWREFEARVGADTKMKLNSWAFRVKASDREVYLTEFLRQKS